MIFRKLLLRVERVGDPATSATHEFRGYLRYPLSYLEPKSDDQLTPRQETEKDSQDE